MHLPGTIIVPLLSVRYPEFVMSLLALDVPDGTHYHITKSMDVTSALNEAIREMHGEWVWFQADDHNWPPDTLTRLLDRDVDVVVPMMNRKSPPFDLVVYKEENMVEWGDGREYPGYVKFDIEELPGEGLVEVHAAGSGSMLVRRHVLDDIGDPWFHNPHATLINDDLEFCRKIREAGYRIMLDTEVSVGHMGTFTSYAMFREGRWGMTFDFGGPGVNRIWLTKEAIQSFDASRGRDEPAVG